MDKNEEFKTIDVKIPSSSVWSIIAETLVISIQEYKANDLIDTETLEFIVYTDEKGIVWIIEKKNKEINQIKIELVTDEYNKFNIIAKNKSKIEKNIIMNVRAIENNRIL